MSPGDTGSFITFYVHSKWFRLHLQRAKRFAETSNWLRQKVPYHVEWIYNFPSAFMAAVLTFVPQTSFCYRLLWEIVNRRNDEHNKRHELLVNVIRCYQLVLVHERNIHLFSLLFSFNQTTRTKFQEKRQFNNFVSWTFQSFQKTKRH